MILDSSAFNAVSSVTCAHQLSNRSFQILCLGSFELFKLTTDFIEALHHDLLQSVTPLGELDLNNRRNFVVTRTKRMDILLAMARSIITDNVSLNALERFI